MAITEGYGLANCPKQRDNIVSIKKQVDCGDYGRWM